MSESTISTNDAPLSSVEIAGRAKGAPVCTVKIYHADPNEALTKALQLYHEAWAALAEYDDTDD